MAVRICMSIPFQLLIVMIYYGPQSDIRVKTVACVNSPESSMFNFELFDWLLVIFGDLEAVCICDGLLLILEASRYIMSFNRESESNIMAVRICRLIPFHDKFCASRQVTCVIRRSGGKVMALCICDGLHFYPKSISIYYQLHSQIRVKRYGCLNFHGQIFSTFEGDDILWASIGNPSQKVWPSEYTRVFHDKFLSVAIGYLPYSEIWWKSYGRLYLRWASFFS